MRFSLKVICAVFVIVFSVINACAAEKRETKRVLILAGHIKNQPAVKLAEKGIEQVFQTSTEYRIKVDIEYLDLYRFTSKHYKQEMVDLLRHKYGDGKIDCVITILTSALRFMLDDGDKIFPGIPTVFTVVSKPTLTGLNLPGNVTGISYELDIKGTLETALKLQPNTKHVVLVAGVSKTIGGMGQKAKKIFQLYKGDLQFTHLTDHSMEQVLEQVARMPKDTIIFNLGMYRDKAGNVFIPMEAMAQISEKSSVPSYSVFETFMGHGIVGGRLVGFEVQGKKAAQYALAILKGEKPSNLPVTSYGTIVPMFDWRQLQKWGLDEERLPDGSIVHFKELTTWVVHKWYIIGGISLFIIEAILILLLLFNWARRLKAESALRKSHKELEFRVGERTAELAKTNEQLSEEIVKHAGAEEKYRTLVEDSFDGIFVQKGSKIVFVNSHLTKMLGYDEGELLGMDHWLVYHPDYQELTQRRAEARMRGEAVNPQYEVKLHRKDGSSFDGEISAKAISFQGEPGVQVWIRDISERMLAEERINRFAHIFEGSLNEIYLFDADTLKFTQVNSAAQNNLGYTMEELYTLTAIDLKPEITTESFAELVAPLRKGEKEKIVFETVHKRKDQSLYNVEVHLQLLKHDHEAIFAAIILDTTRRKRAEERMEGLNRLKEELLGLGSLTDKMKRITDAVVDILDADFARIWLTNQGDMCDSGCMHAKVREGPHVCRERNRCLHLVAGSGRYTHMDGAHGRVPFGCYKIGRVAAADEPGFLTNDVTHDPRVHNHEWAQELGLVSFAGYRLVSHEGAPIGVLALFSKQALSPSEEALLQTIAGTASEVVQTSRSVDALRESEDNFRQLNTELDAKNKELEQVLYATSHDLRSPLVNVQGFNKELDASLLELNAFLKSEDVPQTVKERCAPIIEVDIPESLHYILSSTSKMDALLNGLLVLSRLGRQKLTLKKLDMDRIMEDVVSDFEHEIQEKNVKIDISQLPPCRGDKLQINRVFSNLMGNALKYLDPDRPGVVTISAKKEPDGIYYFIEDNGIGIPGKQQTKIFDLFYKLDPKTEGIGLGLNIVKQLLDKHGGNMGVNSKPGEGTTVIIFLPDSE